ncbi:enoyl-CoA hydratase/isomerase family protein [Nocardiopsis salina]|uniref:enoyl-CoA hydratase/isomerase family protein n=1 Tax=Nocardiopsis salina TaxID=245836 RepID=UPI000346049E|nr:enoyl-CoA hydratase/isomerase family protein [Nocardiopsis salina]
MSAGPGTGAGEAGEQGEVLAEVRGRVGHLTLNRPRAINALNHPMVRRIDEVLTAWEQDDTVVAVVVDGAGDRGLCAGGDVRMMRDSALGDGTEAAAFWHDEYVLNAHIARFAKPFVALMDGVVMGGGVGVSAHGSVRVVTERSKVGMPEATIGFTPDVGGTFLLSRAPGEVGTHLALTAGSVGAGDAIALGLADTHVPSERLADLTAALLEVTASDQVTAVVERFAEPSPDAPLSAGRAWIDACYSAGTAEEIVARLRSHGAPEAKEAARTVLGKSPTSVKVTLEALRRARELPDLPAVLEQEYRVSCGFLTGSDLAEGIRAQVVDKDRDPHWDPSTLEAVTDVERFFAPVASGPLDVPR